MDSDGYIGGVMTLYKLNTYCGSVKLHCYVWAGSEESARQMFAYTHPKYQLVSIEEVFGDDSEPFCTTLTSIEWSLL